MKFLLGCLVAILLTISTTTVLAVKAGVASCPVIKCSGTSLNSCTVSHTSPGGSDTSSDWYIDKIEKSNTVSSGERLFLSAMLRYHYVCGKSTYRRLWENARCVYQANDKVPGSKIIVWYRNNDGHARVFTKIGYFIHQSECTTGNTCIICISASSKDCSFSQESPPDCS